MLIILKIDFTSINWADVSLTALIIPLVYFLIKIFFIDRPIVNISFGPELYFQHPQPPRFVTLGWEYDIIIKNNSNTVARNITLKISESNNFLTNPKSHKLFPEFLHLDPFKEFKTEGKTIIELAQEEFINIKHSEEQGVFIHEVGDGKYQNPEIELKPENLKQKVFYIQYSNSFGITFYTKYSFKNNKQDQKVTFFKPKY